MASLSRRFHFRKLNPLVLTIAFVAASASMVCAQISGGCVEGVGPNNERQACSSGSGGGGSGSGSRFEGFSEWLREKIYGSPNPEPSPHEIARQQSYDLNEEGVALAKQGRFAEAKEKFRQASNVDPSNKKALGNYYLAQAQIYLQSGDENQALQAARQARDTDPTLPQDWIAWIAQMESKLKEQARSEHTARSVNQLAETLKSNPSPPTQGGLDFMTAKAQPPPGGAYIASGNGFVGGTAWVVGYNFKNADPAVVAKSREMLRQQMELAGIPYSAAIDFQRYNFVIGIAASTSIFTDLRKRVLFDELKNGRFSRDTQVAYNSLKGRHFNDLGCHSNGAMICLAAIENRDIKVDHVALYGPQITRESLEMWNELVRSGQVKSVQIFINQNDPVPPVAMLAGSRDAITAGASVALFKTDVLVRTINETAPRIAVRSFGCGSGLPTLTCHDMTGYKSNSGCVARSSGEAVPGTALPGRGSLTEPPPPC